MSLTDADRSEICWAHYELPPRDTGELLDIVEAIVARHVAAAVQATTERVEALAGEWAVEGGEMTHWFASQVLYNTIDQARSAALAGSTDPTPDTRRWVHCERDDCPTTAEFPAHAHRADTLDPTHPDKAVES